MKVHHNSSEAGVAHLLPMLLVFVAVVGVLGFGVYSVVQKNSTDATGTGTSALNNKTPTEAIKDINNLEIRNDESLMSAESTSVEADANDTDSNDASAEGVAQ